MSNGTSFRVVICGKPNANGTPALMAGGWHEYPQLSGTRVWNVPIVSLSLDGGLTWTNIGLPFPTIPPGSTLVQGYVLALGYYAPTDTFYVTYRWNNTGVDNQNISYSYNGTTWTFISGGPDPVGSTYTTLPYPNGTKVSDIGNSIPPVGVEFIYCASSGHNQIITTHGHEYYKAGWGNVWIYVDGAEVEVTGLEDVSNITAGEGVIIASGVSWDGTQDMQLHVVSTDNGVTWNPVADLVDVYGIGQGGGYNPQFVYCSPDGVGPPLPKGFLAIGDFRDAYDGSKRYIMPPMSLDGLEFTTDYPGEGGLFYGTSNGSRIVAYGWSIDSYEIFWHSDDQGRTWTAIAAPTGPDGEQISQLLDACWDGTQFIFVGNDGAGRPIAMKSPDGIIWTTHFIDSNNNIDDVYQEADLYGVAFGNGVYVAVGVSWMDDEEAILYRSTDGITWTKQVITIYPIRSEFEDVVWNGSLFVAVGYDDEGAGNAWVMTSSDGLTWTKRTVPMEVDGQFYGVGCKPDGMCVAVGERWAESTPSVAVSPDGITWTAVDIPTFPHHDVATCYNVAWNGSLWCAVGQQTISYNMAYVMTSPDGVAWTIRQIIGNKIDTFLRDVIATPVNPVEVDLSHRTDVFSLSVWIKGGDDGTLWGTSWFGDNMTNVNGSPTDGQFATWIRSADFSELVSFGYRKTGILINPAIWSHVLLSVSTNYPSGSRIFQLWINDVDMFTGDYQWPPNDDSPAFFMKWHGKPFVINGAATIGSTTANSGPYAKFDVAEAWFAPGQFIDFSVVANRRKFRSAGGTAVSLGPDGSLPTGIAPPVYFSGDATTFPVNKGTGGAFTQSGPITNAPTNPPGATAVSFVAYTYLLNPSLNAP